MSMKRGIVVAIVSTPLSPADEWLFLRGADEPPMTVEELRALGFEVFDEPVTPLWDRFTP